LLIGVRLFTPPAEPAVPAFPATGSPFVGHTRSSSTHRLSILCISPTFTGDSSVLAFDYICSGTSDELRPFAKVCSFPALRLLWSLRRSSRTLSDCSTWHYVMSLPRSQHQTLQGHLGSDSQYNPSRSLRYPEWKAAKSGFAVLRPL
jgi:hypothetical protein